MKQCTKCNIKKLLSEFGKHKITKDGTTHQCKKCSNANHAKWYATPEGRAKHMLAEIKKQTKGKRANFEKTLTINDILPALQAGKCQLTGLLFDFKPAQTTFRNPYAPSLDRIDSKKGYTKSNVRIVLWLVNAAKQECSDEETLPILEAMVKGIKKNVKENTAAPVPTGDHPTGNFDTKYGALFTAGFGQDYHYAYYHSGAVQGQDVNHRPQESSGDSVGRGSEEVGTPQALARIENNGESEPTIVWIADRRGYIPNKS